MMNAQASDHRTTIETASPPGPPTTSESKSRTGRPQWLSVSRLGVLVAFVITVVVFTLLRPDVFAELDTWRGILNQAAIPAVIAMGLTVTLILGDFDLSIGATFGVAMAVSVSLMVNNSLPWGLAAVAGILVAGLIGVVNGVLVTVAKVNSFIGTLAMGSVIGGIDARVSNQETIATNVPESFSDFGTAKFLNLSLALWIAVVLAVLLYVLVSHTEAGRYFYAVGGNPEAARLAGLTVRTLRTVGFVFAAVAAGIGGVLLAAQTASYYPNSGGGYLLPAYAAAFLGTALGGGRFGILATVFGVIFLQTLQTGLNVLNVQPWIVMLVQGLVLIFAVMVSSLGAGLRSKVRAAK